MTTARETSRDRYTASVGRIARGGSLNLLGAGAGAALSLAVTWLVARGASPTVAGTFFAATSVFLIASTLAELGSEVSLARFLPRFVAQGRIGEAVTCLRAAVVASLGAGALVAAGLVLLRHPVEALVGTEPGVEQAVVVLAVFVPVVALLNTALSATRGLSTVRPTVLDKTGRGLLQVALVGTAVGLGGGIVVLTAAWAVPYLVAATAAGWWLGVLVRRLARRERVTARPRAEVLREYTRYTWPRAVAQLCQIVMQRADIVLVAALRSPAEAAVYTVATRFLVVGQLAVHAIGQVLAPQTSLLLGAGDRAAAMRLFQTATTWTMAFTWPLHLATAGSAALLLEFFGGPAYLPGVPVVAVLALAALVSTACGPVDTMLLMTGRSGLSLVNNVVGLGILIGMDLFLVPRLGIVGAAVGWAAAIVARNVLGVAQVRRQLAMWPFTRDAVLVAAAATAALGIPLAVLHWTGHSGAVPSAVTVLGALAVYFSWLLLASVHGLGRRGT